MVYEQHRICLGEWNAQTPQGFWDTNGSPNLGQTTRLYDKQPKKRICRIVDFVFLVGHKVELKESEKKNKFLDLARELRKLWNMKVTFLPIVIGTVTLFTQPLRSGRI